MSSKSVQIIGGPARQHAHVTEGNRLKVDMALGDSPSIDAFDRLRVSNPLTILDSILKYGKDENAWEEQLTGGETSVHHFDEASALLTVSTSGDTTNVHRRSGYFDAENGIFLELTATGVDSWKVELQSFRQ